MAQEDRVNVLAFDPGLGQGFLCRGHNQVLERQRIQAPELGMAAAHDGHCVILHDVTSMIESLFIWILFG